MLFLENALLIYVYFSFMIRAVGVPFILLLTTGNSLRGYSIKTGILGVLSTSIVALLYTTSYDFFIFQNEGIVRDFETTTDLLEHIFFEVLDGFLFGALGFFHLINLIKAIKPSIMYSANKTVAFLFTRETVRETFLLKLSASKKVHSMLKNAFDLHLEESKETDDNSAPCCSTNAHALLNFSKVIERTETVGGLVWCWKSFLNRTLVHKEGIMVNSRLVLCNLLQFMAAILACYSVPAFIHRNVFPKLYPPHEVVDCGLSKFNPENCIFQTVPFPTGVAICHGIHFNDENCFSDYLTQPFSEKLGSRYSNVSAVDFLCSEMADFLDDVNDTAWALVYDGKDSQEFIDASSEVVNTLLCQGMYLFNETLWMAVDNSPDPTIICHAPTTEILCFNRQPEAQANATVDFRTAMDSLLLAYNNKYKQVVQPVVECLESHANEKVMNEVFSGATSSLQNTAIQTTEASWSTLFSTPGVSNLTSFDINQQMENWVGSAINPETYHLLDCPLHLILSSLNMQLLVLLILSFSNLLVNKRHLKRAPLSARSKANKSVETRGDPSNKD